MSFFWLLSTFLLLDATACFNDRLFTREPLERWSHSPENCGINFLPLKIRYYPCFKLLPIKEQKIRAAYDHIMATYPKDNSTRSNNRPSPRFVGGNDSLPGEFPWSVSINELFDIPSPGSDYWSLSNCNAAFILSDWVLTAAHCVITDNETLPAYRIRIRYNSEALRYEDLYPVMAAKIFVHPDYIKTRRHEGVDIALIRLTQNVSFEQIHKRNYFRANALCLPDTTWSIGNTNQDVFWSSSFGPMNYSGASPQVLQKFMLVPQERIDRRYNLTYLETPFRFGYASCQGDSGSPLAYHNADGRYFIAGVHSKGGGGLCSQYFGWKADVPHPRNLNWVKETISNEMGWS